MSKHDYNEILNDLTARATAVAQTGTEQEKEKFNATLKSLASASNTNPDLRQAALQLRLPDVTVSRNEEGNLSFGRGTAVNNTLPKEFAATATVVKPGETLIVGSQDAIGVLNPLAPKRQTTEAVTGNQLDMIGDSATSPALRGISTQLSQIKSIADPVERQRALLNLNGSISTAMNARQIELINQQERAYGVPELEARLAAEEAADRADEQWQQFQRDSPITEEVRNRLRVAKSDAYTFGQRAIATDPVLTSLRSEIDTTNGLIELDAQDPSSKIRTAAKLEWNDYTPEQKIKGKLVADTLYNKKGSTDADAIRARNNAQYEELFNLLDDQGLLLAKVFDPSSAGRASQYKELAQNAMPGLDINTAGAYIDGIKKALPLAGNEKALEGMDPALRALVTSPEVIALSQKYGMGAQTAVQALQGTKSVAERQIEALNQQRDIAQLAVRLTQRDKIAELTNKPIDLPEPSGLPQLKAIVDEARASGTGIDGIINGQALRNAIDPQNPQANQALLNSVVTYVMPLYRSNGPAMVMGIDPYINIEQDLRNRLNMVAVGMEPSVLDQILGAGIGIALQPPLLTAIQYGTGRVPSTQGYAESIANTEINSKALKYAQQRQEGNK